MSRNPFTAFTKDAPRAATRLWKGEDGLIFAYVALALPVVAGMVGLAVDVGHAYFQQRRMQVVADSAAAAARFAMNQGGNSAAPAEGKAVAGHHGFTSNVAINCASNCDGPIQSTSPRASETGAVEAIVTRTHPAWFGKFFGRTDYTIRAKSLVVPGPTGNVCILALGTGAKNAAGCTSGTAFNVGGNVSFGSDNCGVAVNSASTNSKTIAANFNGNSATVAGSLTVCGGVSANSNLSFTQAYAANTGQATADPYAGTTGAWLSTLASANMTSLGGSASTPVTLTSYFSNTLSGIKSGQMTASIPKSADKSANPITGNWNTAGNYPSMTGGDVSVNGSVTFSIVGTMSDGEIENSSRTTTLINKMTGGVISSSGTLVVATLEGGTVNVRNTAVNPSISPSAGSVYGAAIDLVNGGTVGGTTPGTDGIYTIREMRSGILEGKGGGTFYIGDVSGGTLRNGIFYVNNVTGSVQTSAATLVVMRAASFSGGDAPSFNGPTGIPSTASPNLGIAITSPTTDASATVQKYSMGGSATMSMVGAMYFPVDTSTVSLQGLASACAQIIASVVNMNGNVSLSRNNCNLNPITGAVAGYPVFVE